MNHQIFRNRSLALAMVFSLSLASCARPAAAPAPSAAPAIPAASTPASSVQGLKPGDKIGTMTLSQGPLPFDLAAIPPFPAFCGGSPPLKPDATEGKPGVFTVECTVPTLPKLHIGGGWVSADEKMRDADWSAQRQELYVNGQLINEAAFGSVDADVTVQALPGQAAGEVSVVKLRVWNVILENLTPGQMTLRQVIHFDRPVLQGKIPMAAGVYDVNMKITVDAAAKLPNTTPEPVKITN